MEGNRKHEFGLLNYFEIAFLSMEATNAHLCFVSEVLIESNGTIGHIKVD